MILYLRPTAYLVAVIRGPSVSLGMRWADLERLEGGVCLRLGRLEVYLERVPDHGYRQ